MNRLTKWVAPQPWQVTGVIVNVAVIGTCLVIAGLMLVFS